MHDAIVEVFNGSKSSGRISADGNGGDFKGGPINSPPDFARTFWLADFVAVNLIANGHGADMTGLNIAPNRLDIIALRDADGGDTVAVFNTNSFRNDRADDGP